MTNVLPPFTNPALTFEGVWAAIQESNRYLTEQLAESDRQRKENERMFKEQLAETEKIIKTNSREIGGISKSNGDVAESYFVNSFKKYPHFAGHYISSFATQDRSTHLHCFYRIRYL